MVGVLILDVELQRQAADGEAEGPASADGDHQAAERVGNVTAVGTVEPSSAAAVRALLLPGV